MAISFSLFTLLFSLLGTSPCRAQCQAENKAFLPGEDIVYDLYFNWKFIWKRVGMAGMITTDTVYNGQPAYRFDMLCVGSKQADIFYKMRDTLTSYVSHDLEPLYFRKGAEEGKRYTVDQAWFSYSDGVTHVRQRRRKHDGTIREMTYSDSRCVHDMLSILAQARSFNAADYKVGDKIHFPMATGRRVEEHTLIYRGDKEIEANDGITYRTLVYSFVEYDDRGKEQEVITFFISDDDNHLPIRLDMYLHFGSAKAFFKHVSGNRYPLSSAIKQ